MIYSLAVYRFRLRLSQSYPPPHKRKPKDNLKLFYYLFLTKHLTTHRAS